MCAYWCHSESSWKQFKVSKTLTNMQQTCNKHATVSPQSQLNYLSCNIFSLNENIWFELLTLGNAKVGCLWVEEVCWRSLLGNWKKINKGFSITDVSAQTSPFHGWQMPPCIKCYSKQDFSQACHRRLPNKNLNKLANLRRKRTKKLSY